MTHSANPPASELLSRSGAVISLRGARVHNLKSVSTDIPHGQFVVVTGVSGSGKSSLAFDTLFVEGQRRCLEILGSSVRSRLDQLLRPDIDSLEGLPPVVAVSQRNASPNPRGTLATLTEVANYLRLLFARGGSAHCPKCGQPVTTQTPTEIVDLILSLETGRKVMILAPKVRGRRGGHKDAFSAIVRDGFVRARVNKEIVDAATPPELPATRAHDIEVVIDRIIVKEGLRARLLDSVTLALKQGCDTCVVTQEQDGNWHDRLLSSRYACPECQVSLAELEPRTLNFNSPYGACGACSGLGHVDQHPCSECQGDRLAPTGRSVTYDGVTLPRFLRQTVLEALSIARKWHKSSSPIASRIVPEIVKRLQFLEQVGLSYLTLDRPLDTLSGGELQRCRLAGSLGSGLVGICYILDEPTTGLHARDTERLVGALRTLRDQGNSLLVVEHDMAVIRQADWLLDLGPGAGQDGGELIAAGIVDDVIRHPNSITAQFMKNSHCVKHRTQRTVDKDRSLRLSNLSQRNLKISAVQFPLGVLCCVTGVSGSGKSSLVSECLVPAIRESLASRERVALNAPVTSAATSSKARRSRDSASGRSKSSNRRTTAADRNEKPTVRIKGTKPETSEPDPPGLRESATLPILGFLDATGVEQLTRLVEVDQSPLGRSPRASPATLSGIWTEMRRLLARTREARRLGFGAAHFSTLNSVGRCPACRGIGLRETGLTSIVLASSLCHVCRGTRFNPQTLEIRFLGKNAAEWLELRISEALPLLQNFETISGVLQTFCDVGLGYLTLGQPASTLSGGEAQRVRLACELTSQISGHTLYVLDEPTTGLHPADVARLIQLMHRLVDQGHSVIVIEHHQDVICESDWLIDLGPEGGSDGGRIVAEGTPSDVARKGIGWTAAALREPLIARGVSLP